MADRAVLLSGEHPSLPRAELQALLAVHDPGAQTTDLGPNVVQVTPRDASATDAALARMALAHTHGLLWGHTTELDDAAAIARDRADGLGSIAVRATRRGDDRSLSGADAERRIGQAMRDAGHPIDLDTPERTIAVWIDGGSFVLVERKGEPDRGRFEARRVTGRAHFSPVTLHPRRAASLVHLAGVAPPGRIYDPFCGTGGILLEAAMEGHDVLGSDRDPIMVQGTLETLTDAASEALDGAAFVADIGAAPDLADAVAGIVTDLPYGRASGTQSEGLDTLYDRSLAAFAQLLVPGGRAVIGCADPGHLDAEAHGFEVEQRHEEFVHRSMTRTYLVLRRR